MIVNSANSASIATMTSSIIKYRQLIYDLVKREVLGRYRGSLAGVAWSFVTPLLMLAIYTFFFSVVFKSRWGAGPTVGRADFAIILFAGLIVNALFSECLSRAPLLITSNVNYVKKVVFPLEVLPCIALGSALFQMFVSFVVLMVVQLLLGKHLSWMVIFLPVIIFPLTLVALGVSWFLSALGVYIRDISQIITVLLSVLLFVSPVFYPLSAISGIFRDIVICNPITLIIEETRAVLIYGNMPNWHYLLIYTLFAVTIAWAGFYFFQKTRKGFADVL